MKVELCDIMLENSDAEKHNFNSNSKLRETIEGTNADIPSEIKHPHIIVFTVLCDQYTPRLSKNIIFETER